MDGIAQLAPDDRAEFFRQTAVVFKPVCSPEIIEKDFWVCWTLYRIFGVLRLQPRLIFKGGTSLSKGYNAIERFSEDVDLSLSRCDLGFSDERDPEKQGISKKEQSRRIDALVACCRKIIHDHVLVEIQKDFSSILGSSGWRVELDSRDEQTILFIYPGSGLYKGKISFIAPSIRLEMGARSDDWPAMEREIKPYAAEVFPQLFRINSSVQVNTLDATRTFWEKATLLHGEYHRPANRAAHERLSRHYYDLYQLSKTDIAQRALENIALLTRVIQHKTLFFSSAWAKYETASPGSFHLIPPKDRMQSLRNDYNQTKEMIFSESPPSWNDIVNGLSELENSINAV